MKSIKQNSSSYSLPTTYRKKALASAMSAALVSSMSYGDFHNWSISEIYTNSDSSVQYIELFTASDGQQNLAGNTIRAFGADGAAGKSFMFSSDISGSTTQKNVLIATESFETLTGIIPDYILPDGFIFPDGGRIDFATVDSVEFTNAQLPKNGVQSIDGNVLPVTASPTNFAGSTTIIDSAIVSSFDAATLKLDIPVLDIPGFGVAKITLLLTDPVALEFTLTEEFYIYEEGIVAGSNPATFIGIVLATPVVKVDEVRYDLTFDLLDDDPVVFGNIQVLAVDDPNAPEPEPEPEPEPDPLQLSIDAGRNQYNLRCARCHGATGGGGIGPALTTSNFNTFTFLQQKIDLTMPQDFPGNCVDGGSQTCATDVANYVFNVIQQ